jgi:farnesyl-diphosphate farnesyltransferase
MMAHPEEWKPLYEVRKKYKAYKPDTRNLNYLSGELSDIEFCYAALSKVSRSFSVAIRLLPDELRDAVCIFYLVLRGLDSIEDDTNVEKEVRKDLLAKYYTFLDDPGWSISGIGTNMDYRMLLQNFRKVISSYRRLDVNYRQVIQRISKRMGNGMIKYLDRPLEYTGEYNEYCYYVAGLVGVGLTDLFVISGLEDEHLGKRKDLQVAMGQFLQKTNIIRDIREDLEEGRTFWPRQIWGKYATEMHDFKDSDFTESVFVLNHMVTDALAQAPQCLEYLRMVRNPGIFQFCAIPQVMAIATLAEVFNNPDVFKKNVKIRKGLAATLFINTIDFKNALVIFHSMAERIYNKISLNDPNIELHIKILKKILAVTESFTIYRNQRKSSRELNDRAEIVIHPLLNINTQ